MTFICFDLCPVISGVCTCLISCNTQGAQSRRLMPLQGRRLVDQRRVDVLFLCRHDQKVPTKDFCLSVRPSHHILIFCRNICSDTLSLTHITSCTVVSQVNSCQLSNNIFMAGCVLTLTPHKCNITTAFMGEVEKVERKQCDNMHSSCFVPASQKCSAVSVSSQSLCYITGTKTLACLF